MVNLWGAINSGVSGKYFQHVTTGRIVRIVEFVSGSVGRKKPKSIYYNRSTHRRVWAHQ